jgi:hypothetical protein
MAATRIIEEEHGTYVGTPRSPHQGYYAGDFSARPITLNAFAAVNDAQNGPTNQPAGDWS